MRDKEIGGGVVEEPIYQSNKAVDKLFKDVEKHRKILEKERSKTENIDIENQYSIVKNPN